jgi:hypothetical protein
MKRIVIFALAIALPLFAHAQGKDAPEFLFSEDSKIADTRENFAERLQTRKLIEADAWLNAPLTRLDYVLVRMQARLEQSIPATVQEYAPTYFERKVVYANFTSKPTTDIDVRYYAEKGRLLVTADIGDLGKPKKPMKEFCELISQVMQGAFSFKQAGYLWHNYALGPLMRDASSRPEYQQAVENLAGSMVVTINLSSIYKVGERNALYQVVCRKQGEKDPMEFIRSSGMLQH